MLGTNGDSLGIRQLQQRIKELEEENERLKEDKKLDKFSLLDVKTPERLKKKLNELVDYINKE